RRRYEAEQEAEQKAVPRRRGGSRAGGRALPDLGHHRSPTAPARAAEWREVLERSMEPDKQPGAGQVARRDRRGRAEEGKGRIGGDGYARCPGGRRGGP